MIIFLYFKTPSTLLSNKLLVMALKRQSSATSQRKLKCLALHISDRDAHGAGLLQRQRTAVQAATLLLCDGVFRDNFLKSRETSVISSFQVTSMTSKYYFHPIRRQTISVQEWPVNT